MASMDHDSPTTAAERDTDMIDSPTGDQSIAVKQEDQAMGTTTNDDVDMDAEMKEEMDLVANTFNDETHDHSGFEAFSYTRRNIPAYNPADEPEETFAINKYALTSVQNNAYLAAINKALPPPQITVAPGEHNSGCNGAPGHATPPPSPPQTNLKFASNRPLAPAPWAGPDPQADLPASIKKHQKLHFRVLEIKPKVTLLPRRYWIAVLPPSNTSPHLSSAKLAPMWMKGNRLTTVETIWKMFAVKAMQEDFGLWLAGEHLWDGKEVDGGGKGKDGGWGAKGVRMEECDLFNDKIVVLRAIEFGKEGALGTGRKITEGLVTAEREIIELD